MEAQLPILSERETRPATRLRLLRFYLPRLLAATGHEREMWVYAVALQQLGEWVLLSHQQAYCEHVYRSEKWGWKWLSLSRFRFSQHLLECLRVCLRHQLRFPPNYCDAGQEALAWQRVQRYLQKTMPLVERLLTEQEEGVKQLEH